METTNDVNANLVKSKCDKRDYFVGTLENGLRYLLVSDMDADKSSASMTVNIGSLQDPRTHSGLAHFCEHMLFMGTEKYPSENEFEVYLTVNAGYSNAYTDGRKTNYYFESGNSGFMKALDMFSQFFIKPLFAESSVEREMMAVDSEHKKNIQSDVWRAMQLLRSQADPNSYFNHFSTGDYNSLNKPDTRDKLIEFHSTFYSSHLMGLVILTNKPIVELKQTVLEMFTPIPRINVTLANYMAVEPYNQSNLQLLYHVVPVTQKDEIKFNWYINDYYGQYYKNNPLSVISAILGHEGPNSIMSSLVKDDLALDLTSGFNTIGNSFTYFYIKIQLTKKGLKEWEEVAKRVIYMVRKLQSKEFSNEFYEDCKQIRQLKFDYKNKEDPIDYTSDLSPNLLDYELSDVLVGENLIGELDQERVSTMLKRLALENFNIYITSQEINALDCEHTEPVYGTKFNRKPLPESIKVMWNEDLTKLYVGPHNFDYPPKNTFIPKDLSLKQTNTPLKYPELILDDKKNTVWFKKDETFNLPKTVVYAQIYFDHQEFLKIGEYFALFDVWKGMVENELRELNYMASEADTCFEIYFNNDGLELRVEGYSDSIFSACELLITKLVDVTPHGKEEMFRSQVEKFNKRYRNFFFEAPYIQSGNYLTYLLTHPSADPDTKLEELNKLTLEYLEKITRHYLANTRFEWLIQGNLLKDEAIKIATKCMAIIQSKFQGVTIEKCPEFRVLNLKENENNTFLLNSRDEANLNSGLISYFQLGNLDLLGQVHSKIVRCIFGDAFFNELRTKQALGYVAQMFSHELRNIHGMIFRIQSSVRSPEYVWGKVSEFIAEGETKLKEMTKETFEEHVQSVETELKVRDLKLSEEAWRNFREIKNRNFNFDAKELFLALIKNVTKDDILAFYRKYFIVKAKRLDLTLLSKNLIQENTEYIEVNKKLQNEKGIVRKTYNSISALQKSNGLYEDLTFLK